MAAMANTTPPRPGKSMWYNIYFMTSRGHRWHKFADAATLEEAVKKAKLQWELSIDYNEHVSIRIERQFK